MAGLKLLGVLHGSQEPASSVLVPRPLTPTCCTELWSTAPDRPIDRQTSLLHPCLVPQLAAMATQQHRVGAEAQRGRTAWGEAQTGAYPGDSYASPLDFVTFRITIWTGWRCSPLQTHCQLAKRLDQTSVRQLLKLPVLFDRFPKHFLHQEYLLKILDAPETFVKICLCRTTGSLQSMEQPFCRWDPSLLGMNTSHQRTSWQRSPSSATLYFASNTTISS